MTVAIEKPHGMTNIKQVACGWKHCIAVTYRGDVYAWGIGAGGVLGLGNEFDMYTPVLVRFVYVCMYVCMYEVMCTRGW
jgi:alpha-tubulin suppressor-like RCC1 family protein